MDKYLKNKKINKFEKEIEPQEILLDSLAQKKEKEIGVSEKKLETPIPQRIIFGVRVAILILFFVFAGRTFQLQIIEGKNYSELSEKNKFIIKEIQAERGVIYDKYFNQLVFNKSSFDLICSGKLATDNIDHQTLLKIKTSPEDYPGCEIKNNTVREYASGPLFAHLIGYQRQMGDTAGLEQYYNGALEPKMGELQIKRDARENFISEEIVSLPQSGDSLVLWLDSGLQEKIAVSLEEAIKRAGARGGAAVAMDPKTGGVLALVSWPSFDNNLFSGGISQKQWEKMTNDRDKPLFNRAISGIGYPSGSTIKPIIGLAALEEGIITPETKIYSPLEICVRNPWYPDKEDCYADWMYHGISDLRRAIAESVNTFFYQVGGGYENFKGLGAKKIKEWLEIFGWGSKTGIDLPGEGDGILPDLTKDWRLGDTYHFSIGQGPLSIPPIQEAAAYVAIANGGKIFQPQVVYKIIDQDKKTVKEMKPVFLKEIPVSKSNLEVVRQGMRQAVTTPESPSHILNDLPVAASAKTGTAQTNEEDVYHNWVTVFAPYDDPQIVLTIVIEDVRGFQAAVLPVAREVLDWYFSTP
ncbi:MAG: penicillin-binding transpeptidase domain-containing protein [bacterium]|nr:penicillin-binding transpeptidase domain-containing protein [bacterium]